MGDNIRVCVRLRPFIPREVGETCCVSMPTKETIVLNHKNGQQNPFVFDRCYWSHDPQGWNDYENDYYEFANQETLQSEIGKDLIEQGLSGFNSTLFAYGQTGSGKTHSVLGPANDPGLLPRVVKGLLESISAKRTEYKNKEGGLFAAVSRVSFVEIYNEQLRDLLFSGKEQKQLNIQARPDGVSVPGLESPVVNEYQEVDDLLELGTKNRTVAATSMNATSSRSHCIFTFKIELEEVEAPGQPKKIVRAWVNLVDLAGSERQKKTGAKGDVLKEGAAINKSLSTLAKVTSALAEGKGQPPFRDSKLTLLLRDSLSGNSKTIMMAAVSPALSNIAESLSTLNFCKQVKEIKTSAVQNQVETEDTGPGLALPGDSGGGGGGGRRKKKRGGGGGGGDHDMNFGETRNFEKDAIIIEQGSEGDEMFFIVEGSCVVEIDGQEVAELQAGSTFGEQAALGITNKRTATVRAAEDCELRVIGVNQDGSKTFSKAEEKISELRARAEVADLLLADFGGEGGGDGGGDQKACEKTREDMLKKAGLTGGVATLSMGIDCPFCTNLSDDPMLEGCLHYFFPRKVHTTFGDDANCSVELRGLGIKPFMCAIYNHDNQLVTIMPASAEDQKATVELEILTADHLKELHTALADDLTVVESFELGQINLSAGSQLLVGEGSMQGKTKRDQLLKMAEDPENNELPAKFTFAVSPKDPAGQESMSMILQKKAISTTDKVLRGLRILVDGVPLKHEKRELQHNDRLILGRSFCFRVCIPKKASKTGQASAQEVKAIPPIAKVEAPFTEEYKTKFLKHMHPTVTFEEEDVKEKESEAQRAPERKKIAHRTTLTARDTVKRDEKKQQKDSGPASKTGDDSGSLNKKACSNDLRLCGGGTGRKDSNPEKIFVEEVKADGKAHAAGVRVGDLLTCVNGDTSEFMLSPAVRLYENFDFPICLEFESHTLNTCDTCPIEPLTRRLLTAVKSGGEDEPGHEPPELSYKELNSLEPQNDAPLLLELEDVFTLVPGPVDVEVIKPTEEDPTIVASLELPEPLELSILKKDDEFISPIGLVIVGEFWHGGPRLAQVRLELEPIGIGVPLTMPEDGWQPGHWQEIVVRLESDHHTPKEVPTYDVNAVRITSARKMRPDQLAVRKLRMYFAGEVVKEAVVGWITAHDLAGDLRIGEQPGTREMTITPEDVEDCLAELLELENPLNPEGRWELIEVELPDGSVDKAPDVELLKRLAPTEDDPAKLTFFEKEEPVVVEMEGPVIGPQQHNVTLEFALLEVVNSTMEEYENARRHILRLAERVGPNLATGFVQSYTQLMQVIEEANEITAELRPDDQMRFGIEVLTESFHQDVMPHLGVRLWKRLKGLSLWRAIAYGELAKKKARAAGESEPHILLEEAVATYEVEDFEDRVIQMREIYDCQMHTNKALTFDRNELDPWFPVTFDFIQQIHEIKDRLDLEIDVVCKESHLLECEREHYSKKYEDESGRISKLDDDLATVRHEIWDLRSAQEKVEKEHEQASKELQQVKSDQEEAWSMLREERSSIYPMRELVDHLAQSIREANAKTQETERTCEDLLAEVARLTRRLECPEEELEQQPQQEQQLLKGLGGDNMVFEEDTFGSWTHDDTAKSAANILETRHRKDEEDEYLG